MERKPSGGHCTPQKGRNEMKDTTSIALQQMVEVLSGVQAVFLDIIRHDGLDFDVVVELQNISAVVYSAEKRLSELLENEGVD